MNPKNNKEKIIIEFLMDKKINSLSLVFDPVEKTF